VVRNVESRAGLVIFFWDPLAPHPQDGGVEALLRIPVVHNAPTASNPSTADLLLSSHLTRLECERLVGELEPTFAIATLKNEDLPCTGHLSTRLRPDGPPYRRVF